MMKIISRDEAKSVGLSRYFNGKCCKYGHLAERYVSNKHCVQCRLDDLNRWKLEHPERSKQVIEDWRNNNKDRCREYSKKWAKKNPEKINAKQARRRAARKSSRLSWEDTKKIDALHELAHQLTMETGVKHVVDHIFPLKPSDGLSCGLHVSYNMQVVPWFENTKKSDKLPYYMLNNEGVIDVLLSS